MFRHYYTMYLQIVYTPLTFCNNLFTCHRIILHYSLGGIEATYTKIIRLCLFLMNSQYYYTIFIYYLYFIYFVHFEVYNEFVETGIYIELLKKRKKGKK